MSLELLGGCQLGLGCLTGQALGFGRLSGCTLVFGNLLKAVGISSEGGNASLIGLLFPQHACFFTLLASEESFASFAGLRGSRISLGSLLAGMCLGVVDGLRPIVGGLSLEDGRGRGLLRPHVSRRLIRLHLLQVAGVAGRFAVFAGSPPQGLFFGRPSEARGDFSADGLLARLLGCGGVA